MDDNQTYTVSDEDRAYQGQTHPVVKDENGNSIDFELVITKSCQIFLLHTTPLEEKVGWIEFGLNDFCMTIILENGQQRDLGAQLTKEYSKYIQNAYQVHVVLIEPGTKKYIDGSNYPIILRTD